PSQHCDNNALLRWTGDDTGQRDLHQDGGGRDQLRPDRGKIMTTDPGNSRQRKPHQYGSLPVPEWPEACRGAREEAIRPGLRLEQGGRASHFAEASLKDFTTRYGAYLAYLQRRGILNLKATAAAQVTQPNVKAYVAELRARVSSVTTWNCVY